MQSSPAGLTIAIVCWLESLSLMSQLQSVIRVAARLVMRKQKFDPISNDIRDRLHWLPVKQRIDFELGLLVYKCLHGEVPAYLSEMLELRLDNRALHRLRNTVNRGPRKLVVPRSRLKTFGPRSFATTGPSHWNSLPTEVTDETPTFQPSRTDLKHFYSNSLSRTNRDIITSCTSASAMASL